MFLQYNQAAQQSMNDEDAGHIIITSLPVTCIMINVCTVFILTLPQIAPRKWNLSQSHQRTLSATLKQQTGYGHSHRQKHFITLLLTHKRIDLRLNIPSSNQWQNYRIAEENKNCFHCFESHHGSLHYTVLNCTVLYCNVVNAHIRDCEISQVKQKQTWGLKRKHLHCVCAELLCTVCALCLVASAYVYTVGLSEANIMYYTVSVPFLSDFG